MKAKAFFFLPILDTRVLDSTGALVHMYRTAIRLPETPSVSVFQFVAFGCHHNTLSYPSDSFRLVNRNYLAGK